MNLTISQMGGYDSKEFSRGFEVGFGHPSYPPEVIHRGGKEVFVARLWVRIIGNATMPGIVK
jgi:hypothetical protein